MARLTCKDEISVPHSCSVIAATLRVDTPWPTSQKSQKQRYNIHRHRVFLIISSRSPRTVPMIPLPIDSAPGATRCSLRTPNPACTAHAAITIDLPIDSKRHLQFWYLCLAFSVFVAVTTRALPARLTDHQSLQDRLLRQLGTLPVACLAANDKWR